jgi:hypothetical protein
MGLQATLYRSLLRACREFDVFPALKVLKTKIKS